HLMITDEQHQPQAAQASAGGTGYQLVLVEELRALRQGDPAAVPRVDVDPDEPAAIIYTSGTTGTPKGVIFTNRSILSFISEWGLTEEGFNADMRLLWLLPLGGAPGTIWGIIHTAVRGSTMFLQRSFKPQEAIAALAEHRITCMLGVPILYEQIALQASFEHADL